MFINNRDTVNIMNEATYPKRIASWWSRLDDLLYPEKAVCERIKRRAEALASARIDTVIQFGFHLRFDFMPYFGALHGYLCQVAKELHKYNIRFLDHYSCNVIARPSSNEDKLKYHTCQRHHIDLYPDVVYAEKAGYAGYLFNDLRQINVQTDKPAYTIYYQAEMFCHNNPDYRQMHRNYMERLLAEVPVDGLQVDDMADYAGFATCGCKYCKEGFLREHGHILPDISDRSFWGNTDGHSNTWGNYENPVFRDWVQFRFKNVSEHFKEIKEIIGNRILMTCCSSSGPNVLNALSMQFDGLVDNCDWVMLENCGINTRTADWVRSEPGAMLQKAYAQKYHVQKNSYNPSIACSYSVYSDGAYLGWAVARFWGVVNWCSTLTQGLAEDPTDMKEEAELVGELNRWESDNCDFELSSARDVSEVRIVFDRYCKENGWRDEDNQDQWEHAAGWSRTFIEKSISYRFVRAEELVDADVLLSENTPLIFDRCACLSDEQFKAIVSYAKNGGCLWISLPLGTYDEKGYKREISLLDILKKNNCLNNAIILEKIDTKKEALERIITTGRFKPCIRQISGDKGWSIRLRLYDGKPVMHIINRAIIAVANPEVKDLCAGTGNGAVLQGIKSISTDNRLVYEIDFSGLNCKPWQKPVLMSPELKSHRNMVIERKYGDMIRLSVDTNSIRLYGVII